MSPEHAVLATYYRNNVLHLFAMPSLIACCFLANAVLSTRDVQRLAARIYPYVAAELFMRWSEDELPGIVENALVSLASLGLLEGSGASQVWRRPAPTSEAAMQLHCWHRPRSRPSSATTWRSRCWSRRAAVR